MSDIYSDYYSGLKFSMFLDIAYMSYKQSFHEKNCEIFMNEYQIIVENGSRENLAMSWPFCYFFVSNNGIICQISHIQINKDLGNNYFCNICSLKKKIRNCFNSPLICGIDIEI